VYYNVGIVGFGTMGRALAAGIRRADPGAVVTASTTRRSAAATPFGATVTSTQEVIRCSDLIVLAVKPAHVGSVLAEIEPLTERRHTVVSVAAGVSIASIRKGLGDRCAVLRAMPNIACEVGAGATALAHDGSDVLAARRVASLFDLLGEVVTVDETLLDAVTALSGCGPAYMAFVADALGNAAASIGLPYALSRRLVAQTMLGTGRLMLETGAHPGLIREHVATPAGRTLRALAELESSNLRQTFQRALSAAMDRGQRRNR